jgi:hypothetical protein
MSRAQRVGAGVVVASVVVAALVAWWWPAAAPTAAVAEGAPPPAQVEASSSSPPRERVLFGEVASAAGTPIANAAVTIVAGSERREVNTDAAGAFTIDPLPAHVERVEFAAVGYTTVVVEAGQLPATAEAFWAQTLQLDASQPGIVVFGGPGQLLADATLFEVSERNGRDRVAPVAVSGDDGRLPPVGAGRYIVAHATHGAVEVQRGALEVTLPPSATLQGRVVDERRQAVSDVSLLVRPLIDGIDPLAQAMHQVARRRDPIVVDEQGAFTIEIAAGRVVIDASAPGFRPFLDDNVVARVGTPSPLSIVLEKSPTLAGSVVDKANGAPVAGALVSVDGVRSTLPIRTDDSGHFVVPAVAARASSLTVAAEGFQTVTLGGVDGTNSRLDDLRVELVRGTGQAVVGIGITVGRAPLGALVRTVEPNTPAERAGVRVGEVIVAVDGVTLDDNLSASMGRVRGAPGTSVNLTLEDEQGHRRFLTVERDHITVPGRPFPRH